MDDTSAQEHLPPDPAALADRLRDRRQQRGGRLMVGLTGAPGAGKSTLAAQVRTHLDHLVVVPLDGFHLAAGLIQADGRSERRGAPDTFDVDGFVHLLTRVRHQPDRVAYAPVYSRAMEDPVAGALAIGPETTIVLVEGNYLLLDDGAWAGVRPLLDEVWYLEIDPVERLRRLTDRHVEFGKPPDQAARWATGSDQRNADLIAGTRHRANLVVR